VAYPEAPIGWAPGRANKSVGRLVVAGLVGRAGVRDYFQLLFLTFAVVFLAVAVAAFL
jgi:hypothetical protein